VIDNHPEPPTYRHLALRIVEVLPCSPPQARELLDRLVSDAGPLRWSGNSTHDPVTLKEDARDQIDEEEEEPIRYERIGDADMVPTGRDLDELNGSSPPRQRGGQPGNNNAETHGGYSKGMTPALIGYKAVASTTNNLTEELRTARAMLAYLEQQDPTPGSVQLMGNTITLIGRLVSMRDKMGLPSEEEEEEARVTVEIGEEA